MAKFTDVEKLMLEWLLTDAYNACGTCIELPDQEKCRTILLNIAIKLHVSCGEVVKDGIIASRTSPEQTE